MSVIRYLLSVLGGAAIAFFLLMGLVRLVSAASLKHATHYTVYQTPTGGLDLGYYEMSPDRTFVVAHIADFDTGTTTLPEGYYVFREVIPVDLKEAVPVGTVVEYLFDDMSTVKSDVQLFSL